jgi:hypothetical protein
MPPMRSLAEAIELRRVTGEWDRDDLGQHTVGEDIPNTPYWHELQPVGSWPWLLDSLDPERGRPDNVGAADPGHRACTRATNLLPKPSSLRRLTLRSCGYAAIGNSTGTHASPPMLDFAGPRPFDDLRATRSWSTARPFQRLLFPAAAGVAPVEAGPGHDPDADDAPFVPNHLIMALPQPNNAPAVWTSRMLVAGEPDSNSSDAVLRTRAQDVEHENSTRVPSMHRLLRPVRTWRGEPDEPLDEESDEDGYSDEDDSGYSDLESEHDAAEPVAGPPPPLARPAPHFAAEHELENAWLPLLATGEGTGTAARYGAGVAQCQNGLRWGLASIDHPAAPFHFRRRWDGRGRAPRPGLDQQQRVEEEPLGVADPEEEYDEEEGEEAGNGAVPVAMTPEEEERIAEESYGEGPRDRRAADYYTPAAPPEAPTAEWARDAAPMMRAPDPAGWTASVVQAVPRHEAVALLRGRRARFGWSVDEVGAAGTPREREVARMRREVAVRRLEVEREAVRQDGFHPGGSGRFSLQLGE